VLAATLESQLPSAAKPPPTTSPANEAPVRAIDELEQIFHDAERPRERHLIGAEAEKFGVDARTLEPLPYEGPSSILAIFERLQKRHGWSPVSESSGSPVIALERGNASITLEPGAQLELSGAPWPDVHAIRRDGDAWRAFGGLRLVVRGDGWRWRRFIAAAGAEQEG